jgi:hypothetical protein
MPLFLPFRSMFTRGIDSQRKRTLRMRRNQMKTALILQTAVLAAFASSAVNAQTTSVGPVTATITQWNYDQIGGVVNGFLIGTNVLLTFRQPVCGGLATLGNVGDSVTYSGVAHTFPSGFQIVDVTSYSDGGMTYPGAPAFTKPSAYPLPAARFRSSTTIRRAGPLMVSFSPRRAAGPYRRWWQTAHRGRCRAAKSYSWILGSQTRR